MPNTPYTQQRAVQFRGPTTSDDYNKRVEENYEDLTLLYNQVNLTQSSVNSGYSRFMKDQFGILSLINDLENRVMALESNKKTFSFYRDDNIDNDLFVGTAYEIPKVNQCNLDTLYGTVTLPVVPTSSQSKLSFTDNNGNINIPSSLGTTVVGSGADNSQAIIDTSPPELAIARNIGSIWQRNVVTANPVYGGAQLTLYIAAPTGLFTTANSNSITINPFPAFSTDITEVAYTTNTSPTMSDSDGYLEFPAYYPSDPNSIGQTPPGSWVGDIDKRAGFRTYYFDPLPITGLRIGLSQSDYYYDGTNYVYSYGASLMDLRYGKFINTGQIIIRVDAPTNGVINRIENVTPQIFNVDQATLANVFSYTAIYETSYNSGFYTTDPLGVTASSRAWIRVTLNETSGGGTPALNGLSVTYS